MEAYAKNGLCVTFHRGVYRGSLDEDHLGGHKCVFDNDKDSNGGGGKSRGGDDGSSMWWRNVFKGKFSKVRSYKKKWVVSI